MILLCLHRPFSSAPCSWTPLDSIPSAPAIFYFPQVIQEPFSRTAAVPGGASESPAPWPLFLQMARWASPRKRPSSSHFLFSFLFFIRLHKRLHSGRRSQKWGRRSTRRYGAGCACPHDNWDCALRRLYISIISHFFRPFNTIII